MLQIRSDYGRREVVRPGDEAFVPSPLPGVERLMLDREEAARLAAASGAVTEAKI